MDLFSLLAFTVAVLAAGSASVVGFGFGSIVTPILALHLGAEVAIPVVAVPHAVATGVRWWRLRRSTNRSHLLRFGILSAFGGLLGALLYGRLHGPALAVILGILLILTALAELTGWMDRWTPGKGLSWMLGGLSGFFGGVAGNQGGLRAAALSVYGLPPVEFVATATAIALMVDVARTPVYIWQAGAVLIGTRGLIVALTAGAVIGTYLGERILVVLARPRFGRVVSLAVGTLGVWLIVRAA